MLSLSAIVLVGAVNLMVPTPDRENVPKRELPVENGRVTSTYGHRTDPFHKAGRFHEGLDIAAPYGSTIRPVAPGLVVFTGSYEGFGNLVVVRHGNDLTSHYAHCWGVKVKVGQLVTKENALGFVGSSGRATGPHLHLEVRFKGVSVNPTWILTER
jgi:murein DD-endopeptidase MepM/ murein hydrolase activator NlpD